jgi:hypothetical protein
MQFNDYGLGSYSRYEKMLLEFLDLVALAILPSLFILDIVLPPFDLIELLPFFYELFLLILDDFSDDFMDLDVCDFLPLVLRLKMVALSY